MVYFLLLLLLLSGLFSLSMLRQQDRLLGFYFDLLARIVVLEEELEKKDDPKD